MSVRIAQAVQTLLHVGDHSVIQFSGSDDDGHRYIGIGLSAENIRRLRAGDPAVVDMSKHGLPEGSKMVIFYGSTEAEMEQLVRRHFNVTTIQ